MRDLTFDRRLTIAVPGDFHQALADTAALHGQSVADLVRGELQRRLAAEPVSFDRFPSLDRRPPSRTSR